MDLELGFSSLAPQHEQGIRAVEGSEGEGRAFTSDPSFRHPEERVWEEGTL